jgi:hypothetical protein
VRCADQAGHCDYTAVGRRSAEPPVAARTTASPWHATVALTLQYGEGSDMPWAGVGRPVLVQAQQYKPYAVQSAASSEVTDSVTGIASAGAPCPL